MASDVVALLDFVGWTGKHEVNIVGISLGGMIAMSPLHAAIAYAVRVLTHLL